MRRVLILLAFPLVAFGQDKPPAPTQEQIAEANVRMAMLRTQRDEANDQIALLRIELQRAQEKACKPEPDPGKPK